MIYLDDVQLSDSLLSGSIKNAAVVACSDMGAWAWKTVGQYNVLIELKQMLADSIIGPLAASGTVSLHGWFYDAVAAANRSV